jgi:hypothetical protein
VPLSLANLQSRKVFYFKQASVTIKVRNDIINFFYPVAATFAADIMQQTQTKKEKRKVADGMHAVSRGHFQLNYYFLQAPI